MHSFTNLQKFKEKDFKDKELKIKGFVLREHSGNDIDDNDDNFTLKYGYKNVDIDVNGGAIGYHKDGSDYTLDISLNKTFTGGSLNFVIDNDNLLKSQHSMGKVLLFDGDITH